MIISNAKDRPLNLNPGTLPDLQDALMDWFQNLTFTKISKEVIDFENVETPTSYSFLGVRQPMNAQQLMMKPEGQRSWKWETIHALPDLVLNTDEIITFADTPYRVMGKLDFKEYGYVEYHIVEDYKNT